MDGIACRDESGSCDEGLRLEAKISALIDSAERGETAAADALFGALYQELRRLADRELARCGAGASLATTSLLHEAYLDIAPREGLSFPDRARFFGYAARVMRGLIIDRLRCRPARRSGAGGSSSPRSTDGRADRRG